MKPLSVIELQLTASEKIQFHYSMGSLFHGALMGIIDTEYADYLHTMQLRPYSQCLYYDRDRSSWIWRLSTFDAQAAEQVLTQAISLDKLFLRAKQAEVNITGGEVVREMTYQELLDKHFAHTNDTRRIKLEFLSPTSFKSDNAYMIYPSERLVVGSLLNKWNAYSNVKLEENNLLEDLRGEVYTAGYNLRMNSFSIEGTWIPAFKGMLTIGLKGNIMANRVIRLLCEFSQFSGIGIKTALGMGGVECSFE